MIPPIGRLLLEGHDADVWLSHGFHGRLQQRFGADHLRFSTSLLRRTGRATAATASAFCALMSPHGAAQQIAGGCGDDC